MAHMSTNMTNLSSSSRRARRRLRRGFSLIEVIVAVTIIALFAAVIAPTLLGRVGAARVEKARVEAAAIAQQIKIFVSDQKNSSSLNSDFTLDMLVPKYLESLDDLKDPWDTPYILDRPGLNGRDFDVVSLGADGVRGGEGENADIIHP
jgi:general secretion pathway protein G